MVNTTRRAETGGDLVINALGQKCPMPILALRDGLEEVRVGQTVELIGDDAGSKADVPAFCRRTGHELIKSWEDKGTLHFLIRRGK